MAHKQSRTHLQTLKGHTESIFSIVIGKDGRIYSGSGVIRVWSGIDGTHLQTLQGHVCDVYTLAVGKDDRIYSGSATTVNIW